MGGGGVLDSSVVHGGHPSVLSKNVCCVKDGGHNGNDRLYTAKETENESPSVKLRGRPRDGTSAAEQRRQPE